MPSFKDDQIIIYLINYLIGMSEGFGDCMLPNTLLDLHSLHLSRVLSQDITSSRASSPSGMSWWSIGLPCAYRKRHDLC
jgi:hypothetical protein